MLLGEDKSKPFHVTLSNVVSPNGIALSALLPISGQNCLKFVHTDTISFIFSVTYVFSLNFCLSLPF